MPKKSKNVVKSKKGGFLSRAINLTKKAVKIATKKPEIPCSQTKMFVKLNERIKKVLGNDRSENKIIREGDFERVIISGKGFLRSPQPFIEGEWQLKVIKANNSVKYIVVINKSILKFEKYCKYNSVIQNITEGDDVEILSLKRDGDKHKDIISRESVKNNKFILHKFRTNVEDVIAFIAEFM